MMNSSRSRRRVLLFEDWPGADWAAWETAIRQGDPFEEAGPMAKWRSTTKNTVAQSYGGWLAWLKANGLLDETESPADRVRLERVKCYIVDLRRDCRDTTVEIRIHGLRRAIQGMAPDVSWHWLRKVVSHIRLNIQNRKDKRPRIRSSRELHELGLLLMDEADGYSTVPWKRATRYRDGLIIALLAARPLRIRNFAALEIGRQIVENSDGFMIHVPADEIKTHTELEFSLPADLTGPMRHYLAVYRPLLLGCKEGNHLWITKYGTCMQEQAIYKCVTKLTREAFGVSVNPHLFRDCLATSMVIEDPEHVHVASKLLGHGTIETTTRHYNQATSLSAGRAIANNIRDLRRRPMKDIKPKTVA